MLLVDDREGSKDLLSPLRMYGVPCELQRLAFADFAFIGQGIGGAEVFIGIELKETEDLIQSMRSARFVGHQLRGLQTLYDRAWLITEGIWKAGEEGVLEYQHRGTWRPAGRGGRSRVMASDVDSWLLTQVIRGGITHHHCSTRRDTIRFVSTVYHWWCDKELQEHRSHQAIYLPPPDRVMLTEPSTCLKMLSCLPNVGWEKAAALEEACGGSIRALTRMTAADMQEVDGIGKTIAKKIDAALGV